MGNAIRRDKRFLFTPVWGVGVVAGAAAAIVLYGYGVIVRALAVPMRAGPLGAHSASRITPAQFAFATLVCALFATVAAVIIARTAARPAKAFLYSTILPTVLSLADPLGAAHTAGATKVALVLAHLLAAAIVIPAIAWRLAKVAMSARR